MPITIPFIREFNFNYLRSEVVTPLIRRVVARNPGPFTFHGTGTYIVGHGQVAIIDPGPDLESHIEAILQAVSGETVTHILVTHTHTDHSPAARVIKSETGASTYAYGPHASNKSERHIKVEEGSDHKFSPDHKLRDGEVINGKNWTIQAVHTPGHTSNHICYHLAEEHALFSGDHVMGWSTTVISPPDGNMAAYTSSLNKCLARNDKVYWPTHGAPVRDPKALVSAFIAHREERHRQILNYLHKGHTSIKEIAMDLYMGLDPSLLPAARRSILAHLILLVEEGNVDTDGTPDEESCYRIVTSKASLR